MEGRFELTTEKFTLLDALRVPKKPRVDQQLKMLTYGLCTLELDAAAIAAGIGHDYSTDILGHNAVAIGLNGVEAASNIVTALSLISNQTYHPQKTAMIALNLISGINLLALTDSFHSGPFFGIPQMGMGTTLAAPAFAFSMLCDFSAAAIDLYYSTEQGYLESMLGEAEFYHQKLKKMEQMYFDAAPPKLIKEDEDFKDQLHDDHSNDPSYQRRKEAYSQLLQKQQVLLFDLECQLHYYENRDNENLDLAIKPSIVASGKQRILNILQEDQGDRYSFYKTQMQHNIDDSYQSRHATTEANRQKLHYHNKLKLGVKAASFGGMLLQAMPTILLLASSTLVIPYINIISLCLISIVALVYFWQLRYINQLASPAVTEVDKPPLPEGLDILTSSQHDEASTPTPTPTLTPIVEQALSPTRRSTPKSPKKFFDGKEIAATETHQNEDGTPSPRTPTRPLRSPSPTPSEKRKKPKNLGSGSLYIVPEGEEGNISRSSSETNFLKSLSQNSLL